MLTIFYTPNFIRRYKHLDPVLQGEVKDKIESFRTIKNHLILKVHKLKGSLDNTYAFSVNFKVRVIFEYQKNKKNVNLLYVGSHDELYS